MQTIKYSSSRAQGDSPTRMSASPVVARGSGIGMQIHPANDFIQAEVDLFMHSHGSVQAGDLTKLERTVRCATNSANDCQIYTSRVVAHADDAIRSGSGLKNRPRSIPNGTPVSNVGAAQGGFPRGLQTSRSQVGSKETRESRPRPKTARCVTSLGRVQEHNARKQMAAGRQSCDPDNRIIVPSNMKNEWLILETYQQLMLEDKHAAEQRKAREAIRCYRQGLDEQIRQKLAKTECEKRETALAREEQRRLFAEHESRQCLLRDASKRNIMEEKRDRAYQILENERRREKEHREKQIDDERIIAACKEKLREEEEVQLKKRKEMAQSLVVMQRENVAKRAERERQKAQAAEEDKRLMQEYREMLDRENEERASVHRRRMERYEMIGKQWAEKGAGKRQNNIEIEEERRVLAEMRRKEKADEDRERRDKQTLRLERSKCIWDNRCLTEEKIARKKAEDEEAAKYARQFRSEGEKYVAEELCRKRETLLQHKAYARELIDQMREDKAKRMTVLMSDRERKINSRTLRLLQTDRNLQARICRRILQKDPASKGAPPHGTSNG